MQSPDQRIGALVKAHMAVEGVGQAAISGQLGMSQAAISRRLTGEVSFSAAELHAISKILAVPVAHLIEGLPVKAAL